MSLLRFQEVYKAEYVDRGLIFKKSGIEFLAGSYLLEELFKIMKIRDKEKRDKSFVEFDKKMLRIIIENKEKILQRVGGYKYKNFNLNPETLKFLLEDVSLDKKEEYIQESLFDLLNIASKIVNNIEVIEHLEDNASNFINGDLHFISEYFKNHLGLNLGLDDVTLALISDEKESSEIKNFFLEELNSYLEKNTIDFIKIDMKLTRLIVSSPKYLDKVFSLFKENKIKLENKRIIFEGIESEDDLEILKEKILKEKQWLNRRNITILVQGYYFHKPEIIL